MERGLKKDESQLQAYVFDRIFLYNPQQKQMHLVWYTVLIGL